MTMKSSRKKVLFPATSSNVSGCSKKKKRFACIAKDSFSTNISNNRIYISLICFIASKVHILHFPAFQHLPKKGYFLFSAGQNVPAKRSQPEYLGPNHFTLIIQRNPLISNDHLSDEKLLLSDHCYYPHFHFRHVDGKKSALNRK